MRLLSNVFHTWETLAPYARKALAGSLIVQYAFVASGQKAEERVRYNILCLVCEDISPFLGCYGDPVAQTPFINRLASEGIRYTGMYTPVGVSSPSRAALITGMYPTAVGANYMRNMGDGRYLPEGILPYEVVLPAGTGCFTEYLRAGGYYCTNNSKTDYQFQSPITAWDENGSNAHWKNRVGNMPFFAIYNMGITHESQIWMRTGDSLSVDPEDVPLPPYYPDHPVIRKDVARMYSNIRLMDAEVGKYLNELEEAGVLDETIVIFYSDNGGPLPRGKRELYETGTHVPFIVRFPDGYRAGEVDDRLCSFIDIPATILSLAGIHPPKWMHGVSFAGKFTGDRREYVFGARNRMDAADDKAGYARDGRYRYIRNYRPGTPGYMDVAYRKQMPMMMKLLEMLEEGSLDEIGQRWFTWQRPVEELYDVMLDPYELNNLADSQESSGVLERLRHAYDTWDSTYNNHWKLSEAESREVFWPRGKQPVTEPPVFISKAGTVEMIPATPGASIAYQINNAGLRPGHWQLYTKPLQAKSGDTISAVSVRVGYAQSQPTSLTVQ